MFAFKTAKTVDFIVIFETAKAVLFQIAFVNDIYNL